MSLLISGRPAYEYHETDIDWAPTLKLGHSKISSDTVAKSVERANRTKSRRERAKSAHYTTRPKSVKLEANHDSAVAEDPVIVEEEAVWDVCKYIIILYIKQCYIKQM